MSAIQITALVIWGIIIVASVIVEAATEELISVWFAISAIISLILSLFNVSVVVQIVIFVGLSAALFILFRKLIKKISKNQDIPTNLDRAIDQIGIALTDFKAGEKGEVRVNYRIWSAISEEDICRDEKVIIIKIDGNKLVVKKTEEINIK